MQYGIRKDAERSAQRHRFFTGRRVAVSGGGGSVGQELVAPLLEHDVALVRVLDNNETALFQLGERLQARNRVEVFHCDIRDEHELNRTLSGMDVCFHAAALKHVPLCEGSPFSAIQTNIIGTQNVIRAALRNRLSHVLFTSSDKAVNPTNVMGTSKLMGERLFTAANSLNEGVTRCVFSSTRFGNVAGSRGSVIPLFCEQIRDGRDVTLTDSRMTRFMMTLEEAVRMVIDTMPMSRGGEIFVTKMRSVAIAVLADVVIRLVAPLYGREPSTVAIREIGSRPGEKLWEELSTEEELRRTFDLGDTLVVLPALRSFHEDVVYNYGEQRLRAIEHIYNSANEAVIPEADIRALLLMAGVLPEDVARRLSTIRGRAA
jgi:FlaA1/EpsC-like NDP-sugar epimerase